MVMLENYSAKYLINKGFPYEINCQNCVFLRAGTASDISRSKEHVLVTEESFLSGMSFSKDVGFS